MKKILDFTPYVGVGDVKFGENRSQVRAALGQPKEYKKNEFSKNTLDDFDYFQIFYTEGNQVEAIEMYGNVELLFKGTNLFGLKEGELISLIQDPEIEKDEYSVTFPSVGLSVTFSEGKPESILAYQNGYM